MKNRAKCKLCNTTIESFHKHDHVTCQCGEISVDGGPDYFRASAKDFSNFLRIDDEGNEVVVTLVDPKEKELTKPSKEELIKMLDDMVSNIESLPQEAMLCNITNYDWCSLLILLSSIFKTKD